MGAYAQAAFHAKNTALAKDRPGNKASNNKQHEDRNGMVSHVFQILADANISNLNSSACPIYTSTIIPSLNWALLTAIRSVKPNALTELDVVIRQIIQAS